MSDLTVGSIQALYENNRKSPLSKYPRVQIIWIRSVPTNGKTRYRALVSDGVYYMQAMLATQYAPVIEQGKIKKFTIVKLKETVLNVGDNNKMLIVLGLDVITVDVDSPIGNPVKLGGPVDPSSPVTNTANGRSMSMSSLQSLPQSPTPSLSQGLSPTQPTDDYSSQTPSSQSSRSFQPYPSTVNTGPSTQQPSYPQHGLSTPYVRPPNSMKLISMNKSHMNPYSSSQNSSVKPYYSSQNSNMNPHFSSQSNNINSYSSLQHNNINPYSSSQQGAYPSSQKNSVNLFSASSQPKRIITSTVPSRIPAPFMKISELSPYVKSWTLRARVSLKTPIRTWTNARSTGRLFSVNFVDETGEIGATGFNDQCISHKTLYMIHTQPS
ncbi:hypothetical protein K501DRAFT_332007 [Backusella circina FSU 941]|nr:hypothetical protein K501DRAFT_332007 [Backusella circina FSU 941]